MAVECYLRIRHPRQTCVGQPLQEKDATSSTNGFISVTDKIIGVGRHGRVIFEGFMRGTPVACERVDLDFVEEIKTESALAQIFMHQNIAKSYGIKRTSESTYYVRELCGSSLKDFINYFATKSKELVTDIEALRFLRELKGNMSPCLMNKRHQPSPLVLQLLRYIKAFYLFLLV
jgi:serine/threonine protein kinase